MGKVSVRSSLVARMCVGVYEGVGICALAAPKKLTGEVV